MQKMDVRNRKTSLVNKSNKWEQVFYVAFICGVFIYLFLFFSRIHPLMLHDGDDWGYASYSRGALPIWGYWNPSKVFPEIAMPICVNIAAYFVMPLGFDLSWSITYTMAAVVSIAITVYIVLMERYLRYQYGNSKAYCILLTMVFFICHFLVFRTKRDHNDHLFYCWNVNCYFNYLIPSLISAGIVLLMESSTVFKRFADDAHLIFQGVLFLICYLAIFSNLYSSYILAVYLGMTLLAAAVNIGFHPSEIGRIAAQNAWRMVLMILWIVCAIFELNGGRATQISTTPGNLSMIKSVAREYLERISDVNMKFIWICMIPCIVSVIVCLHSGIRNQKEKTFIRGFILGIGGMCIASVYLVLVSSVTGNGYLSRPDVVFGAYFFFLIASFSAWNYLIEKIPRIIMIVPMIVLVMIFETDRRYDTFKEISVDGLSAQTCADINAAIIGQIVEADQAHMTYTDVYIPEGPYWYIGDAIARTLLKCGIIDQEVYTTLIVDPYFYERYGID